MGAAETTSAIDQYRYHYYWSIIYWENKGTITMVIFDKIWVWADEWLDRFKLKYILWSVGWTNMKNFRLKKTPQGEAFFETWHRQISQRTFMA